MSERWGYRLYYHKTDGGAEYLCSEAVPGTDEGKIPSRLVIRLDGEPEYVNPGADELFEAASYFLKGEHPGCGVSKADALIRLTKAVSAYEKAQKGQ